MKLLIAHLLVTVLGADISFRKGDLLSRALEQRIFNDCERYFETQGTYQQGVPKCAPIVNVGDYTFEHIQTYLRRRRGQLFDEIVVSHQYASPDISIPLTVCATFKDGSGELTSRGNYDPYEPIYQKDE